MIIIIAQSVSNLELQYAPLASRDTHVARLQGAGLRGSYANADDPRFPYLSSEHPVWIK